MKRIFVLLAIIVVLSSSCIQHQSKNYLQFIDPMIGTTRGTTYSAKQHKADHETNGQTIPSVTAPFGMTQWTPQIQSSQQKCIAPFYTGSMALEGFRATHWLNGSCTQDYGSFTIFPDNIEDDFQFLPDQRHTIYFMNPEYTSPAYTSVLFSDLNIMTEITATKRCGFFKFSWLDPKKPTIFIDVNNDNGEGYIKIDIGKQEITGFNPVNRIYNGKGKPAGIAGYFVAHFDHPIKGYGSYGNMGFDDDIAERKNQKKMGVYVSFDLSDNSPVKAKIGTSFTSIENARKNLEAEIPDWNFNRTRNQLEETWNNYLGRIEVESKDTSELTKFYTALYHSLIHPRLFSDVNGDYPEFSKQFRIKNSKEFDYYGDFSNWDIFRAQMPLLSIVAPAEYLDMVKSLIVKAEQGGWLPTFPLWNNYTSAMIGDHSTAIINDAYQKGFNFDIEKAYRFMRKNAYEIPEKNDYKDGKGRRALESYLQFGYIPLDDEVLTAFHTNGQVSRTLEYAYNDWCVAQVAKKLGKQNDFNDLMIRSQNYSNVFDDSTGWMNGRFGDGSFTTEFTPGQNSYFITEGTAKQYSWFVPHDIEGLIELMGGKETFGLKLNQLFSNNEYWHGNEPGHHVPYLFNSISNWEMTQKTVKNLLKTEYGEDAGGLSGNDDAGQLSAWYVFSAMGFYPVCPGDNTYQLSSPIFQKVTLHLDKRFYKKSKFTIVTDSNIPEKIYKSADLNGKNCGFAFSHDDLKNGGELRFSSNLQ